MKAFIELVKAYAKANGIPGWILNDVLFYLAAISFLIIVFGQLWKFIKFIILRKKQKLLNKNLKPYFSQSDVENATKYYIPTKYQNVAPSEDEEPGKNNIASEKNKLIPLFLHEIFRKNSMGNNFYLLLADSGMGKTTFMINLYLAYKNQITMPWVPKSEIVLFPLGAPDILGKIDTIKDKRNTILLLDAFDEDIKSDEKYTNRVKEILVKVNEFKEVVITCRTQFFPSEKEEPKETGFISFGSENEEKNFQKYYISVFSDKDIKKYLRMKYSVLHLIKRRKAYYIVKRSPNLMVRPMLLSYIEDLVDTNKVFEFSYQIYDELIEKWIVRESKKPNIKSKYGSKENYQKLLFEFSKSLAIDLYERKEERGGYFISKDENFGSNNGLKLKEIEEEYNELSDKEKRNRSLLNRNAEGYYKFSHKSILEYFLAQKAIESDKFLVKLDFKGIAAAQYFVNELLVQKLKKTSGTFSIGKDRNTKMKPLKTLKIEKLGKIDKLVITQLDHIKPIWLKCMNNLTSLIIGDIEKYKLLYGLYLFIYYNNIVMCLDDWLDRLNQYYWLGLNSLIDIRYRLDHLPLGDLRSMLNRKDLLNREEQPYMMLQGIWQDLRVWFDLRDLLNLLDFKDQKVWGDRLDQQDREVWRDRLDLQDLQDKLYPRDLTVLLNRPNIRDILDRQNLLDLLDWRDLLEQIDPIEHLEPPGRQIWQDGVGWQEGPALADRLGLLSLLDAKENKKFTNDLITIKSYCMEMKSLQELLPNCKIIY